MQREQTLSACIHFIDGPRTARTRGTSASPILPIILHDKKGMRVNLNKHRREFYFLPPVDRPLNTLTKIIARDIWQTLYCNYGLCKNHIFSQSMPPLFFFFFLYINTGCACMAASVFQNLRCCQKHLRFAFWAAI